MVQLPYSGKLSREKTFAKNTIFAERTFADCSLLPRQRTPRSKFRGENFRVQPKLTKFAKVFSLESFPLYGIPVQGATPDAKLEKAVSCYKADRLGDSLPSFRSVWSSLAVCKFCAAGEERSERGHRRVCEPLMPDFMVPNAHHNNCNHVSSVGLLSNSLCKNLAWWAVTRRTSKNHKAVKIGGWVLTRVWGQYGKCSIGPQSSKCIHSK